MAVSDAIPLFLRRVRAVLYRHEAGRAVLYAIAAIGALAIAVPVLGNVFGASRASAMALLGIGGLATVLVIVGGVVMGLVVPRKKWSHDPDLARWVGTRRTEVASDLLSSVELANAPSRPGATKSAPCRSAYRVRQASESSRAR